MPAAPGRAVGVVVIRAVLLPLQLLRRLVLVRQREQEGLFVHLVAVFPLQEGHDSVSTAALPVVLRLDQSDGGPDAVDAVPELLLGVAVLRGAVDELHF